MFDLLVLSNLVRVALEQIRALFELDSEKAVLEQLSRFEKVSFLRGKTPHRTIALMISALISPMLLSCPRALTRTLLPRLKASTSSRKQ